MTERRTPGRGFVSFKQQSSYFFRPCLVKSSCFYQTPLLLHFLLAYEKIIFANCRDQGSRRPIFFVKSGYYIWQPFLLLFHLSDRNDCRPFISSCCSINYYWPRLFYKIEKMGSLIEHDWVIRLSHCQLMAGILSTNFKS